VEGPIREAFGLPERSEENEGMLDWIYPAGDPAERMLAASGESRVGLLRLADEVLDALDRLAEVAEGAEFVLDERLASLDERAVSNPMLTDALRSFRTMRPIWERYSKRFARLRTLADRGDSDLAPAPPPFSAN
jgi:hypothetical protein